MLSQKKKNGFTLIELLVVIALMLSILGIAIVSFINISNKKKQEAWEDVKAQIETAATEYFTANEYLFEGLGEGVTGTISVGKLVTEDYINKITDPMSGKSISTCAVVLVESKNNKLTAMFDENSKTSPETNCDSDNSIEITEPGAPNITGIMISKLDNKNNPYNNWYHDGARFTLEYNTGGNGPISSILSCKTVNGYCEANSSDGPSIEYSLENSSSENPTASVCFSISNVSGKTSKKCASARIDNIAPRCSVSATPTGWTNKNAIITGVCTDKGSGCNSPTVTRTISNDSPDSGTTESPGSVVDNVGHTAPCRAATVYVDKTKPTCTLKISSNNKMTNGWYLGKTTFAAETVSPDVVKWFYKTDKWNNDTEHKYPDESISGYYITGSGNRKITVNLTDRAGNSGSCDIDVRLYNQCDEVIYKDGTKCSKSCDGGTYNKLAYDKYTNARCSSKDKTSGGSKCNTQPCYATSCSATVTMNNSDCKSSAGNHVSAQLKVQCNGKIDYAEVKYYYPNARNSVCSANTSNEAVCTHYPGGSHTCNSSEKASNNVNGAVFNFTGCATNSLKYKYKVVANGTTIHSYGSSWSTLNYSINLNQEPACNPDRGSAWFN